MSSVVDRLQEYIVSEVQERGVKVFLKTDLGPELQIYDSAAPESSGEGLPIKYGVKVRDSQGRTLGSYGGYPATNPIKAAVVGGVLGVGLFVIFAGFLRIIKR